MAQSQAEDPFTTLAVRQSVAEKLEAAKPYPSMSYNDLLREMVDIYEERQD